MSKIIIRQKKSLSGVPVKLRKVIWGLGLHYVNHEKVQKDNNCIRGMINKVKHLVDYQLVKDK